MCRMGCSGRRPKGLEDLNVYRIQREQEAKVREDLNVQRRLGACEGQALALWAPGRVFFVVRGLSPAIAPSSWPSCFRRERH